MIPHTVTDPACIYYVRPRWFDVSLSHPRLRDWFRHPLVCAEWRRHQRARGKGCEACVPSKWAIELADAPDWDD